MKSILTIFFCLGLFVSLTSCELKDKLDAMMDMPETTETMAETTKKMQNSTCYMIMTMREGNSKINRVRSLLDEINAYSTIKAKVVAATSFYKAQEYGLWAGICEEDNLQKREELKQIAIAELFGILDHFEIEIDQTSSPVLKNQKADNYFAMSAVLHRTNDLQEKAASEKGINPESVYDIIVSALKKEQNGLEKTISEKEVMKAEKSAVKLLKSRVNTLIAILISFSTGEADWMDKMSTLRLPVFNNYLFPRWRWLPRIFRGGIYLKSNFEKLNTDTKEYLTDEVIPHLDRTINDLNELGIRLRLDSEITNIIYNLDISKSNQESALEDEKGQKFVSYIKKLKELVR